MAQMPEKHRFVVRVIGACVVVLWILGAVCMGYFIYALAVASHVRQSPDQVSFEHKGRIVFLAPGQMHRFRMSMVLGFVFIMCGAALAGIRYALRPREHAERA